MMKYDVEAFIEQMNARKDVLIFLDEAPLSKKLRIKRAADEFTLTELSEILSISAGALSDYEHGKKISSRHIGIIEDYLYSQWYEDKVLVDRIEQ